MKLGGNPYSNVREGIDAIRSVSTFCFGGRRMRKGDRGQRPGYKAHLAFDVESGGRLFANSESTRHALAGVRIDVG